MNQRRAVELNRIVKDIFESAALGVFEDGAHLRFKGEYYAVSLDGKTPVTGSPGMGQAGRFQNIFEAAVVKENKSPKNGPGHVHDDNEKTEGGIDGGRGGDGGAEEDAPEDSDDKPVNTYNPDTKAVFRYLDTYDMTVGRSEAMMYADVRHPGSEIMLNQVNSFMNFVCNDAMEEGGGK
jgi:hypothetical protein